MDTQLTVAEAVALCAASTSSFARDLANTYGQRGQLSDKQLPWLYKLAEEQATPPAPAPKAEGVSLVGLVALMVGALEHLKHPKVTVCLAEVPVLQLSVAGERARHPGTLNVTDGGGWGEGLWYGRVHTDGSWQPSARCTPVVTDALVAWNADPAGIAAEHGRTTGHCCFCRRQLSTDESLAVGYGPVCADNYGLPWGAVPAAEPEADQGVGAEREEDYAAHQGTALMAANIMGSDDG